MLPEECRVDDKAGDIRIISSAKKDCVRGEIEHSSHLSVLWFSWFQVLVINCSLILLNERFSKQLINFNCVLS